MFFFTFPYFNSIKVQLELNLVQRVLSISIYFNSIKVQLEQAEKWNHLQSLKDFNSIKVQLELRGPNLPTHFVLISIP